jgi:hypothetical protein
MLQSFQTHEPHYHDPTRQPQTKGPQVPDGYPARVDVTPQTSETRGPPSEHHPNIERSYPRPGEIEAEQNAADVGDAPVRWSLQALS